ncbi:Crp/Fnr family transcriptional regulator [Streptomyces sp. DSM 116496]|uniref:Crp/Fnr family transcriptional regulator n=1 Tax=Streptomyces stoeckheimensis TaxID=3344656 RepID=UPI0038B3FC82
MEPAQAGDAEESAQAVHRTTYLGLLESADRSALLALGRELRVAPRSLLIHQSDPSTHTLLITHGWTKAVASSANGYQALLDFYGPGDIVGEAAVLAGRSRDANVIALEPVRAVAVSGDAFRDFLARSPQATLPLLQVLADRVRAADRRREEFVSLTVRERLASLLLELARTVGHRTEEGIELAVPLTQTELAGSVGASRETVMRVLKDLRDRGVVITKRRALVIARPDALRQPHRDDSQREDARLPAAPTTA